MRKDKQEKAGENFREGAHSLSGHAQSTQNISVQRQSRNRQLHIRVLHKLVERKRAVNVKANFRSLQTKGKTAIDCKKTSYKKKEIIQKGGFWVPC